MSSFQSVIASLLRCVKVSPTTEYERTSSTYFKIYFETGISSLACLIGYPGFKTFVGSPTKPYWYVLEDITEHYPSICFISLYNTIQSGIIWFYRRKSCLLLGFKTLTLFSPISDVWFSGSAPFLPRLKAVPMLKTDYISSPTKNIWKNR